MAAIIRIKRSTGTGAPGSLKTGELAYSAGTGLYNNGGDRLYFGKGDDGSGNATTVEVVGGAYFANLADHQPGTLTASSAIVVDGSSKIDTINVDNITIDGNTISSTDANGNIVLDPNGTGVVDVNTSRITNVTDPSGNQDAATKAYVDTKVGASSFNVNGDTGSDTINLQDSDFTIHGGTGIATVLNAANNSLTINLSNTGVTANTYGSATAVPVLTLNEQGQVTVATTATISTTLNTTADTGSGSISLIDSDLSIVSGSGIATTASDNTITIAGTDASTVAKGVASFNSADFSVASGAVSIKTAGVSNTQLENSSITVSGETIALGGSATLSTTNITEGSNLYYTTARADSDAKNAISGGTGVTYNNATGVIEIGQAVGVDDDVTFNDVTVQGNLQVTGTTTTVNSQTLEVSDNMIYMNAAESDGSPTQFVDVGWAANVNETGTYYHVGMFRDATDGVFKVYDSYIPEPDSDVQINTGHASFNYAAFRAGTLTGKYLGFDSDFSAKTTDNLTEGSNLYYTDERVDDRISNLLLAGEAIDLAYDDNANSLTVSAEVATYTNLGVASFDSDQMTVTSGLVTIAELDGGTY